MSRLEEALFAAEIDSQISSIDLHGMRVHEALDELHPFLAECVAYGDRYCEVVHGIGTGRLASAIQEDLARLPSVKGFKQIVGRTIVVFG